MNAQRVPISQLLTDKSTVEDPNQKKTREDWRKAKELEEARKAGNAPAAVDEEGKDINPHIPQYISAAPWYYGTAGPTLKHQRPQDEKQKIYSGIEEWYKKGVDVTKIATKYRKGACENCGAITHKKKDCLERPRKVGAKFTNAEISHDEFVQPDLNPDFDGKRDRWAGYDPANHREIVEEYQKIEEAKRQLKAEKLKEDPNAESSEEEDEDKYADGVDMPGTKVDSKQRITVRNLRIREDTAKYLRNLDPNSAFYDPKTRSMRENPNPAKNPEDLEFAGENFVRYTGDTQSHATAQLFAWEAHGKGVDVHVLAEPTKLELLQKEYESKKEEFKDSVKDNVLQKYGGEEYLKVPPKQLLLAQTETYVEYARDGRIIKGAEKQIIRSRYEEDVLINNHTAVWGSFWKNGEWGYKCCHAFIKNSWCCKQSLGAEQQLDVQTSIEPSIEEPENDTQESDKIEKISKPSSSSSSSSSDEEEKRRSRKRDKKRKKKKKQKDKKKEKDKLQLALEAEDRMNKEYEETISLDERKRKYNSMYEAKAPTEEEVEAYKIKRMREEDPMAMFMSKK
ncbi:CLUMA_CG017451, isoform A [Clunio marinus]|uniref:Pre-mRNA-splicing factor SLU7 n=1 Tax=Clunio marinus TaxID=568069 RepID=A0A1J1IYX0_9DIPT|nr:CLUMA_CG017451, isoform A [Clunio marinus]